MDDFEGHPLSVARARRNLTQKGLATKAGVGRATVWRAEHGYPINAVSRQRLCDFFDMTARELGLIGRNYLHAENKPASKKATGEATTARATAPASFLHKEAPPVRYTPFQAIDLLSETPNVPSEQLAGAWLTLGASHLGQLFENGWSLEGILDSLRVVLQGVQGIPAVTRRRLLQLGAMAAIGRVRLLEGEHVAEEEKIQLTTALGESIEVAWKLFHTIGTTQILAISQALLTLIRQNHYYLYPAVLPMFYSGLYRLIGAAFYFHERHDKARSAFEQAYLVALDGTDAWNMAQSRSWQAYTWYAQESYTEALQTIEGALRLAEQQSEIESLRLRARLLAFGAENAAILGESEGVQDRLYASKQLLEYIPGPHEEFDYTGWFQQAGICALRQGKYELAASQLQHALDALLPHWTLRYISTALPLVSAQTHLGQVEESLNISRQLLPVLKAVRSIRLIQEFVRFLQMEFLTCFPDNRRCQDFVTEAQHALRIA